MSATRKHTATKRQRAKPQKPFDWHLFGRVMLALTALSVATVSLWFGYQQLAKKLDVPIREVVVDGSFHFLDSESIRQAIGPVVASGFFSLDVRDVQQRVLDVPWVASASVRRIWPGTLVIRVEEHQPHLRWGEKKLISREGDLYEPAEMQDFTHLVRLDGDDAYHHEVIATYQLLGRQFREFGNIETVRRSSRGSWSFQLDTGLQVELGKSEMDARILRTTRFMQHFRDQLLAVERIDARYSNGVTVRLKQQNLIDEETAS